MLRWHWDDLSCSEHGATDAQIVGLVLEWAIHLRVILSDPSGSLPAHCWCPPKCLPTALHQHHSAPGAADMPTHLYLGPTADQQHRGEAQGWPLRGSGQEGVLGSFLSTDNQTISVKKYYMVVIQPSVTIWMISPFVFSSTPSLWCSLSYSFWKCHCAISLFFLRARCALTHHERSGLSCSWVICCLSSERC